MSEVKWTKTTAEDVPRPGEDVVVWRDLKPFAGALTMREDAFGEEVPWRWAAQGLTRSTGRVLDDAPHVVGMSAHLLRSWWLRYPSEGWTTATPKDLPTGDELVLVQAEGLVFVGSLKMRADGFGEMTPYRWDVWGLNSAEQSVPISSAALMGSKWARYPPLPWDQ